MTTFLWILVFLFSGIFLLAVVVLFDSHNKIEEKQNQTEDINEYEEKEEDAISFREVLQKQLEEIKLCYPDLETMVERYDFEHCMLFHNRIATKNKKAIFISICRDDCKTACLNAITRLFENNQKIDIDFWICLVVNSHYESVAGNECYEFLKNRGVHIFGALMDGSDNEHLFSNQTYQALIGVSTGCLYHIQVNGNVRKVQKWIDDLDSNSLFSYRMNNKLKLTIKSLKQNLPILLRIKLRLLPKKGMQDLVEMIPHSWSWMIPSIEKGNNELILRAPNERMIIDAYQTLEKKAAESSLYLVKKRMIHETSFICNDELIYQCIVKAIEMSQSVQSIVPISIPASRYYGCYPDWKVCRYMPLYQNEKKSSEGAVQFYLNLLSYCKSINY